MHAHARSQTYTHIHTHTYTNTHTHTHSQTQTLAHTHDKPTHARIMWMDDEGLACVTFFIFRRANICMPRLQAAIVCGAPPPPSSSSSSHAYTYYASEICGRASELTSAAHLVVVRRSFQTHVSKRVHSHFAPPRARVPSCVFIRRWSR